MHDSSSQHDGGRRNVTIDDVNRIAYDIYVRSGSGRNYDQWIADVRAAELVDDTDDRGARDNGFLCPNEHLARGVKPDDVFQHLGAAAAAGD